MEKFSNNEIVAFDLETTGVDPEEDRIIQFGAVKLDGNLKEIDRLELLLNPDYPISKSASLVNGFYQDNVNNKPKFPEVAVTIHGFIGQADLAGHNVISFDLPLLLAEFKRHTSLTIPMTGRKVYDTLELFRHFMPHSLSHALRYYCNEELNNAHDATSDTLAVIKILKAQSEKYQLSDEDAFKISWGNRVTLDGKLGRNYEGEIVIAFGKFRGYTLNELAKMQRGFLNWILDKNFSLETKGYVTRALRGEL